jgi:hypothetical protein
LYAELRKMQNAADAGALAGARELCFGNPANAITAAQDYAINRNGAETADVTVADWTVDVTARENAATFLAGIIGSPSADVGAHAAASCGAAQSACGVFPVAFDLTLWNESLEGQCGKTFYVWAGDKDVEPKVPVEDAPFCDVCNCDIDPSSPGDEVITVDGRAWLDFSGIVDQEKYPDTCAGPGCGQAELSCWIRQGEANQIDLPACVNGDMGVKAGAKNAIADRINTNPWAVVPVYDSGCTSAGCQGEGFHLTKFRCIKIVKWVQQYPLDFKSGAKHCWKGKVVMVQVGCDACETNCGTTSEGGPDPMDVRAVSLTE